MQNTQRYKSAPLLAVAIAALGAALTAQAQSSPVLLYGAPLAVKAGKALAMKICGACHGVDGISTTKEIPSLAGQRANYLYKQLRTYQREGGDRSNPRMYGAVRFLSDDALRQAASYYASLDPPRVDTKAKLEFLDPVQAGADAAAACSGCHGEGGNSTTPGIPRLSGLHPGYLSAAIKAYSDGTRSNDMMNSMVAALAPADIDNIALYFGVQKPVRTSVTVEGDAGSGAKLAAACTACHGEGGNSVKADIPALAGQDPRYLESAIKAYKAGMRKSGAMESPVAALSDTDIANLAAYFAAQTPKGAAIPKRLSAEQWAARCDRCHGVDGNSVQLTVPALAGQRVDYLEKALRAYRAGKRSVQVMDAMTSVLSDTDIHNLALYYGHKQPKAVVFVEVPAKCD